MTFWYILTLGMTLAAFAALVFVIRANSLRSELDTDLRIRALDIVTDLQPQLLSLNVRRALESDRLALESPLVVREVEASVLFRSPRFPVLSANEERQLAEADQETGLITIQDRAGTPYRVASAVLQRPGAQALIIQVAASTAELQPILTQTALMMAVVLLSVLVAASYGSSSTARRALAPVDEIVDRVRHIQANRLDERLDIKADSDELDRLVLMLNQMLDRIEVSFRSARRFAADVSHELQTPIAALRAAVEMAQRGREPGLDIQKLTSDLLTEIDRLSTLVRDLRLLALAEAGSLLDRTDPVDIAALTTECCEIAKALAEDKQIDIQTVVRTQPIVTGSALHLRRVILNLTHNAIRYSPVASRIEVTVGTMDGHAAVAVRDWGCGIDASDLPFIFEPFYRADPARARDTGGTGLGLAIADQICRSHGGRIEVATNPEDGSTFTMLIPTRSA